MKICSNNVLHWMAAVLLLAIAGNVRAEGYDPLAVDPAFHPSHIDLTVHDTARERDIPIRVYLPAKTTPAQVVLFSHGLGGTREGSVFLGEHWAARGYAAVFLQHPGSDDSVWKDKPEQERMQAMKEAASIKNFILRAQDVPAVLDQLAIWNSWIENDKTNAFGGRLDMKKIGMSGHSFGAVTTEAVSGEAMPGDNQGFTDPRIRAAIVFSPSAPHTLSPEEAFASVKIPWLLMTGTKDVTLIGPADMKSRLSVYPALHGAPKYQVVLFNAEHSVFTDRALPGEHEPRNPNHHRVILALSTAFWDAYLRGDAGALAWLNGSGPRSVMESDDQWQSSPH
jgi:predicted dienelactone hydrolase